MSGELRHTETDPQEDVMNKPLIAPEKAAAVEARVVASFRPLVEHLRTGVAPAVSAAGVKMGRSIRESFQRPA